VEDPQSSDGVVTASTEEHIERQRATPGGEGHENSLQILGGAGKKYEEGKFTMKKTRLFELITIAIATQVFPFHSSSLYFFSGSKLVHC